MSIVISYGCSLQGKKERQKEKGESVLKIASQAMRGEDGLMEVVSKLKVYKWTMGWFSGSGALPKVENVTEVGSWSHHHETCVASRYKCYQINCT